MEQPPPITECQDVHDVLALCAQIRTVVDVLDRRESLPPMDRVLAWQAIGQARDELNIVLSQAEDQAVEAMKEAGVKETATSLGVVHVRWQSGSDQWRGYELVGKLAADFVDPLTGEKLAAVPVDVLRSVLAGCRDEKSTSGRFVVEGLNTWLPEQWQTFRTKSDGRERMGLGPKPKR